jgi:hypothetical protein
MNSGDQSDGNGSGVIVTPRWFGELFQFLTTVNKLMVQITNHARIAHAAAKNEAMANSQ